ncbi:hypothetical protein SK128_021518 [Halocaridina rubra]|uniref:C2H2-type domain-containing protein n=1 Tax=Halocaridina rubra TaxID=373956 RepID=A0AAN8X857_HALRR
MCGRLVHWKGCGKGRRDRQAHKEQNAGKAVAEETTAELSELKTRLDVKWREIFLITETTIRKFSEVFKVQENSEDMADCKTDSRNVEESTEEGFVIFIKNEPESEDDNVNTENLQMRPTSPNKNILEEESDTEDVKGNNEMSDIEQDVEGNNVMSDTVDVEGDYVMSDIEEDVEGINITSDIEDGEGNEVIRELYNCLKCREAFDSKAKLREHSLLHDKKYTCPTCDKKFPFSNALDIHIASHLAEKPHVCEMCGRSFNDKKTLKRHILRHKGVRNYICKMCGKGFTTDSNLSVHYKSHSDVRPHACTICDKKFRFRHGLRKHLRVHLNIKPFECSICNKKFVEKSYLTVHERIHRPVPPEDRIHICTLCNKSFVNKKNLLRHNEIHLPRTFVCSYCNKGFTTEKRLKAHVVIHDKTALINETYKCSICDKAFKSLRSLKFHMPVHENRKLYRYDCRDCFKQFSNVKKFKAHMKEHLNEAEGDASKNEANDVFIEIESTPETVGSETTDPVLKNDVNIDDQNQESDGDNTDKCSNEEDVNTVSESDSESSRDIVVKEEKDNDVI